MNATATAQGLGALRASAATIARLEADLVAARDLRRKLARTVAHRHTVAELAEAAAVSEPTVAMWLKGGR